MIILGLALDSQHIVYFFIAVARLGQKAIGFLNASRKAVRKEDVS